MMKKFKDLLTSVDVLNTLHGGVSEPFLSIRENAEGREMRVRVPGVDKGSLQVEIINNQLSVFYFIPIVSSEKLVQMPQVVYNQPIPYFVEVSKIKATYNENELVVDLPFNELSNGYNRKIKIN
jgi:HSP20 family molecular chaperone IbpA